ncbi:hypothetical protein [Nostoc sp.]|uniref:hypothetical protein n=1 Tax=Nostoc sp. TaxID=1180 RepID=UPI002FF6DA41
MSTIASTSSIISTVSSIIDMVDDEKLKQALSQSFLEASEPLQHCESFFELLPTHCWSSKMLATFFYSWKATHLKMLAIYGLSCRLQRLALTRDSQEREQLFLASAFNAETSHEDLGLDYEGVTHAALYEDLANSFLGNYPWQLEEYCLPQARDFQKWIYHNMVVDDISQGLLTNMFSEIYNHGEYTRALLAFSELIDKYYHFSAEEKKKALFYIGVHVADETEVAHFQVVVEALNEYGKATNTPIDYTQAKLLFKEYLTRLGTVMEALTIEMRQEINAAKHLLSVP